MAYMTPVMAQAPGTATNEDAPSLTDHFVSSILPYSAYAASFSTLATPQPLPVIISDRYILPVVVLPTPTPINTVTHWSRATYCSCVLYAKAVLGKVNETWGNAKDITPETQTPSVGAVIITTDGGGHVGVVTETASASVTITEANFVTCASSSRTLPIDDPSIKGYRTY